MTTILSLSTTPPRINQFIYSLDWFNKQLPDFIVKVIINICAKYRRFPVNCRVSEYSKGILLKYKDKFTLNFCYDYGPITKYIGAIEWMKYRELKYDLMIIDDDINYTHKFISKICSGSKRDYICSGSGFNIEYGQYTITAYQPDYVEGYAGIYFKYDLIDNIVDKICQYYKCINDSNDLINMVFRTLFMADDFLISYIYKNKYVFNGLKTELNIQRYGFEGDALQNNTLHGSNMGSYNYLLREKIVIDTIINKIKLNNQLSALLIH